jgi:hypothetical protein
MCPIPPVGRFSDAGRDDRYDRHAGRRDDRHRPDSYTGRDHERQHDRCRDARYDRHAGRRNSYASVASGHDLPRSAAFTHPAAAVDLSVVEAFLSFAIRCVADPETKKYSTEILAKDSAAFLAEVAALFSQPFSPDQISHLMHLISRNMENSNAFYFFGEI